MADGEAAVTGNGCTGCHGVHESIVEATSPFPAIKSQADSAAYEQAEQ